MQLGLEQELKPRTGKAVCDILCLLFFVLVLFRLLVCLSLLCF